MRHILFFVLILVCVHGFNSYNQASGLKIYSLYDALMNVLNKGSAFKDDSEFGIKQTVARSIKKQKYFDCFWKMCHSNQKNSQNRKQKTANLHCKHLITQIIFLSYFNYVKYFR